MRPRRLPHRSGGAIYQAGDGARAHDCRQTVRLLLPALVGPKPDPAVRAVTKWFALGTAATTQGHDRHGRDRFALVAFEHHRPLHHVGAVLHALDRGFRFTPTICHVGPYSAASFKAAGLSTASRNTAVLFAVSGMTGK